MNVWLINPRTDDMISTELPGFVAKEVGCFPPLGLLYVAGAVRERTAHTVRIFDLAARDMTYAELAAHVSSDGPDIVGVTSTTHNLVEARRAAETVKQAAPGIPVCLGGPHVEAFADRALALPCFDSALRGESEYAFPAYLDALDNGESLTAVPGLIYRDGDTIRTNPPSPPINDLDGVPFPARDLIRAKDYSYVLGKRATFTTLLTTRGCPFRCIFCSTPHGGFRMRSPDSIVDEMEACLGYGSEEFHFIDDTFNVRPERVRLVSEAILRRGLKTQWSFRGRVDKVDRESLALAKQSGCGRIHYGIEAGTDEGLDALKKQITTAQAEAAIRMTREAGISSATYFIIGCPHERNRADVMRTIDFAVRVNPDFAMFNIMAIYPHTELFDMAVEQGLVPANFWDEFVENPTPDFRMRFWNASMDAEELTELLRLAYRTFYFRPSVVWRNLKQLGSAGELRHKAAAAIAMLTGGRR